MPRIGRGFSGTRLLRCRSGVSAVEFALILPVLVLLLGGTIELSGAVTAGNRAAFVAETVAQVVTQAKGTIKADEMAGYIKSVALVDPDIVAYAKATGKALDQAVYVNVSSVAFTQTVAACTKNCDYKANVVFSAALAGPKRSCGPLSKGDGNSTTTLPAGVFAATSLVVVDVEVFYRPLMTSFLGKEVSYRRHAYLNPRNVDLVNSVDNCPGYPPP